MIMCQTFKDTYIAMFQDIFPDLVTFVLHQCPPLPLPLKFVLQFTDLVLQRKQLNINLRNLFYNRNKIIQHTCTSLYTYTMYYPVLVIMQMSQHFKLKTLKYLVIHKHIKHIYVYKTYKVYPILYTFKGKKMDSTLGFT